MTASSPASDPHAMTPDNLWVGVYRDRLRGGVGYEFVLAPQGEEGRKILFQDHSTVLALTLSEIEAQMETLEKSAPLIAPGVLSWVPAGMQLYIVWVRGQNLLHSRLVQARSSSSAAEAAEKETGGQAQAVNELSQVKQVIQEMRSALKKEHYDKILADYRTDAVDGGVPWLSLKKNPELARAVDLMRKLEAADLRNEKEPEAAAELIVYWKNLAGEQPPLVQEYIQWAERHLS